MDRTWVLAVAVAVAGSAGAFLIWPSAPPPTVLEVLSPVAAERTITVHVSGLVARPGLVSLPAGSRVADAVIAAGGVHGEADLAALNLAAPLVDGQQLIVPGSGVAPSAAGTIGIRVNTADAEALDGLPGVGPVLAGRIVAHREAHGPFTTVEDLLDVPGIGESKLAAIREVVVVP